MSSDTLIVAILGGVTTIGSLAFGWLRDKKQDNFRAEEQKRLLAHDEYESKVQKLANFREKRLTQLTETLSDLDMDHLDFNQEINLQEVHNYQELMQSIKKYETKLKTKTKELQKLKFQLGDKSLVELLNAQIEIYSQIQKSSSEWDNTIFSIKQEVRTNPEKPIPFNEWKNAIKQIQTEMGAFEAKVESSTVKINQRIEELAVGRGYD